MLPGAPAYRNENVSGAGSPFGASGYDPVRKRRMAQQLAEIAMAARYGAAAYGNPATPSADRRIRDMGLDPTTLLPRTDDSPEAVFARALTGSTAAMQPQQSQQAPPVTVEQFQQPQDPRGDLAPIEQRLLQAQQNLMAKGYGRHPFPVRLGSSFPDEMVMGSEMVPVEQAMTDDRVPTGWASSGVTNMDPEDIQANRRELWQQANERRAAMQRALAPRRARVQQRAAQRAVRRRGIPVELLQRAQRGGQPMDADMMRALMYGRAQQGQQLLGLAQLQQQAQQNRLANQIALRELGLKERQVTDPERANQMTAFLQMMESANPEIQRRGLEGFSALQAGQGVEVDAPEPAYTGQKTRAYGYLTDAEYNDLVNLAKQNNPIGSGFSRGHEGVFAPLVKYLKEHGVPAGQAEDVIDQLENEQGVSEYLIQGGLQAPFGKNWRSVEELKRTIAAVYGVPVEEVD